MKNYSELREHTAARLQRLLFSGSGPKSGRYRRTWKLWQGQCRKAVRQALRRLRNKKAQGRLQPVSLQAIYDAGKEVDPEWLDYLHGHP